MSKSSYSNTIFWWSVTLFLFFFLAIPAAAENWPQWRGSQMNGIGSAENAPVKWDCETNVIWRFALPGPAPSTPVIWGERIFLTSESGGNSLLMAIRTDGKKLWQRVIGQNNRDIRQGESNATAPSPVTDGKHVWAFLGTGELVCFSLDGELVWETNLENRYGEFNTYWGFATSPLLDGDRLYLQLLHENAQLVLALDKSTGNEIWKQNRATDARSECLHSYASPVMYRHNGLTQLITHGADYVVAHNPDSGEELWRCGGLQQSGSYNPNLRFVATPVTAAGLIVVPSAKNGPVLGLNPHGAVGNITGAEKFYHWKLPQNTSDVPSPLVFDGLVYICRENGILICLDAKTGEEIYQESVYRNRHRGSPVIADGRIYLSAYDGTVSVIKAGREYQLLAQNKMDERLSASPVFGNNILFLRTSEALYAISEMSE